jgi:hypothetical protein
MPGGLLQISSFGSQDLFLTGSPEITFFKAVYRRYTNFSIESTPVRFDDKVGFGLTSNVVIPKIGDLINRIYLEVTIPEIDLFRKVPSKVNEEVYILVAKNNYNIIKRFMKINTQAYRNGYEEYISLNSTVQDMVSAINNTFDVESFSVQAKNEFQRILSKTQFSYSEISILDSLDTIKKSDGSLKDNITKDNVLRLLNQAITKSKDVQRFFYNKIIEYKKIIDESKNKYAKCAWVKKLGHALIDRVELLIGGEVIDRQYGEWLDIIHELTASEYMLDSYNKMIGNIDILNVPSRTKKPSHKLYIPLQFWFCRHIGLALPLISLRYHDVALRVQFRPFHDLFYINELTGTETPKDKAFKIKQMGIESVVDYIENHDTNLEANLLIDYIYLDNLERKKFAQSIHEYLIEQVQYSEIKDITEPSIVYQLDFNHPCKEIIWTCHNQESTRFVDGYSELKWNHYTVLSDINPLESASLDFNNMARLKRYSANYYNLVQPYQHHTRTPETGIHVYSFALNPEQHQPSGSCNMSRIKKVLLNLFFNKVVQNKKLKLTAQIYAINYNILRFANGMGGIAYISS